MSRFPTFSSVAIIIAFLLAVPLQQNQNLVSGFNWFNPSPSDQQKEGDIAENIRSKSPDLFTTSTGSGLSLQPWSPLQNLWRAMDSFSYDMMDTLRREFVSSPSVHIRSRPEEYDLFLDVPGYSRDDLQVRLDGDVIHVEGKHACQMQKKQEVEKKKGEEKVGKKEGQEEEVDPFCLTRQMQTDFVLPRDASPKDASVILENGMLKIRVARQVNHGTRNKILEIYDKAKESVQDAYESTKANIGEAIGRMKESVVGPGDKPTEKEAESAAIEVENIQEEL